MSFSYNNSDKLVLDYFLQALKIAEELNDQMKVSGCLINLSIIYTGEGDYEKAFQGYQKIIEISEKIENEGMLSTVFNLFGLILSCLQQK